MIKKAILMIFSSIVIYAIEITDIIDSIDKMNSSVQIPKKIEYNVYDPFSSAKPILNTKHNTKLKTNIILQPIILQTILNNRAFVDGKWYNKGDKVRDYKIEMVNSDSVILVKNFKKTIIRIKKIERILKMKEQKQ